MIILHVTVMVHAYLFYAVINYQCLYLSLFSFSSPSAGDPMANVMASIRSGQVKLRKAKVEEKKPQGNYT